MAVHERNPEPRNPLGMDGIEFAASQPPALGAVLQKMEFMPATRARQSVRFLVGKVSRRSLPVRATSTASAQQHPELARRRA